MWLSLIRIYWLKCRVCMFLCCFLNFLLILFLHKQLIRDGCSWRSTWLVYIKLDVQFIDNCIWYTWPKPVFWSQTKLEKGWEGVLIVILFCQVGSFANLLLFVKNFEIVNRCSLVSIGNNCSKINSNCSNCNNEIVIGVNKC